MTTKTPLLFLQLALVTTVLGCATERTPSLLAANESGLTQRQSFPQISRSPSSNAMILEPGENIRIRGSIKGRYLCSNGEPLVCDGVGGTAYCYCPGVWQHR